MAVMHATRRSLVARSGSSVGMGMPQNSSTAIAPMMERREDSSYLSLGGGSDRKRRLSWCSAVEAVWGADRGFAAPGTTCCSTILATKHRLKAVCDVAFLARGLELEVNSPLCSESLS